MDKHRRCATAWPTARVAETRLPLAYVNQVGGQDELVFDGASFVLNADGKRWRCRCRPGRRRSASPNGARAADGWRCVPGAIADIEEGDAAELSRLRHWACATMWTKNGFPGVVLGLSGGIDSALCAAMAVDALGADRVHCVMLPYRYTSNESLADAAAPREALGVRYDIMPIHAAVEGLTEGAGAGSSPGAEPRHHRGKFAVARARHAADGASPTSSARWC